MPFGRPDREPVLLEDGAGARREYGRRLGDGHGTHDAETGPRALEAWPSPFDPFCA
jgi:hypothetical protein